MSHSTTDETVQQVAATVPFSVAAKTGLRTREMRVLVLATTKNDAARTKEILEDADLSAQICPDIESLLVELPTGVGAIVATDEALDEAGRLALAEALKDQPKWSDVPLLVLSRAPAESGIAEDDILAIGNVTLIERPARVASVVSAVRSALRARQRQYEQRERFQDQALLASIVEGSDDAIISKRLDGTIVSWNAGAERIFGYTAEEAVGQPITLIIPEDRLDEERGIIERLCRGERVDHFETIRVTKSGQLVDISLTVSPIRDASNEIVGASKVARDVTQRRQVEAALREADRRKDEFLATLAHELRNPLAPIRNSLHILRVTGPKDPAIDRVREILDRQVNHMVRLVDDLMEISRITRGKIELRKEQIELAAVIGSAVEASKPAMDAAGQDLVISIPPDGLILDADPVRLSQVFSNLLNNASKYSEARATIWLSARRENGTVMVSVRDSGVGISAEMLPRVFEMFAQVESSLPRAQGGLGIGLTLVRSLVHMHGGSVVATSPGVGRGSEFIVRLPLASGSRTTPTPETTDEHAASLRSLRVLVVDDNHDAADSLGTMLTFLGAETRVTYSGAAALDAIAEFQPTVALLDIGMPGMDGYTMARRVRELRDYRDMTLIALSGWATEEDKRRSLEAGFNYHLIKPPDVEALKALIISLGSRQPKQRAARSHK